MIVHLLVPFAILFVASLCVGAAIWFMFEMAEHVNKALPEADRFDLPLWRTKEQRRLYAEYQRLNPHGRGHKHIAGLMFAAWCLLVISVITFELMRPGR